MTWWWCWCCDPKHRSCTPRSLASSLGRSFFQRIWIVTHSNDIPSRGVYLCCGRINRNIRLCNANKCILGWKRWTFAGCPVLPFSNGSPCLWTALPSIHGTFGKHFFYLISWSGWYNTDTMVISLTYYSHSQYFYIRWISVQWRMSPCISIC